VQSFLLQNEKKNDVKIKILMYKKLIFRQKKVSPKNWKKPVFFRFFDCSVSMVGLKKKIFSESGIHFARACEWFFFRVHTTTVARETRVARVRVRAHKRA
jgi:hypothetical protein